MAMLAAVIASAVTASTAYGYYQSFCGVVLSPGGECRSSGLHSFSFSRSSYPGPSAHNVFVCTYMYNARTAQVRGGIYYCDYTYVAHDYGPTSLADYNARAFYPPSNCCAHTVNGFAAT
jgi:hypothetical protein